MSSCSWHDVTGVSKSYVVSCAELQTLSNSSSSNSSSSSSSSQTTLNSARFRSGSWWPGAFLKLENFALNAHSRDYQSSTWCVPSHVCRFQRSISDLDMWWKQAWRHDGGMPPWMYRNLTNADGPDESYRQCKVHSTYIRVSDGEVIIEVPSLNDSFVVKIFIG